MKAIELLLKYIQAPLLIEFGEESLAGGEVDLSPESEAALEAVLKVVAADGVLKGMYNAEAGDTFPPELARLGFVYEDGNGIADEPEGQSARILLEEFAWWELRFGRGWMMWRFYHEGVGYPVDDAIFY